VNKRIPIGVAIVLVLGLALALCPVQGARAAAPRYVATTGTDAGDCSAIANPCLTISYAIGQAIAGDTIEVAAGTYTPAATIIVNKSLTVLGPQAGIDPRPNASTTRTPGDSSEAIVDGGGSLSTIFKIEADDVVLDGLEVTNGTGDLVYSSSSSPTKYRTVVRYNIIHKSSGDEGVQLKNATDGLIEYNHVYDTGGDGLNFGTYSTGGTIQFNEVHDIWSPDAAIYVYNDGHGPLNATIKGNLVYDVHNNDGIKLGDKGGRDKALAGGSILDNAVHDTNQDGITVYTSDTLVDGNEVYNSTSENGVVYVGESVNNVTITNNNIHDNGSSTDGRTTYGIRVGKGNVYPTNVVVNNNCIVGNEQGLFYNFSTSDPALDAEYNWWGAADGPGGSGSGSGDSASANVDYDPWATAPIAGVCAPASPNADVTIHAYADYPDSDTGYASYRVKIYHAGGSYITYADTNPDGNTTFTLDNGDYEYTVEKWGVVSESQSFTVAGVDQTLDHHLSVITVHAYTGTTAPGTGRAGYRVKLYLADDTYMTYADTDSNGDACFIVPVPAGDDQFKYTAEKWGAVSDKQTIDVDYCSDKPVDHHLSVITVHAYADYPSANTGYAGYRVRLYLAGGAYMNQ